MRVTVILLSAISVITAVDHKLHHTHTLHFKKPDPTLGEFHHGVHHGLKAVAFEAATTAKVTAVNCAGHFLWEAPTGTHVTKLSAVADCKEDGLAVVDVTLSDGVHKFLGVQKGTHVELTKEDFVKKLEGAGCPHAHELPDDVLFAKLKESLKGTLHFKKPDPTLGEFHHGVHHGLKAVAFEAATTAKVTAVNCAGHFLWEAPTGTHVTKLSAVADCKEDGLAVVDVTLSDGVHKFLGVQKGTHVELTKEDFVKKLEGAGCPHAHELPDDVLFAKLKESLKGTLHFKKPDPTLGEFHHGVHHGLKAVAFEAATTAKVTAVNCAGHFLWEAPTGTHVTKLSAVADCKEDGLAVVDVTLSDGVQKGTHVELTKEDFVKKLEGAGCPHAHELPDDVLFAKLKESLKGTLHFKKPDPTLGEFHHGVHHGLKAVAFEAATTAKVTAVNCAGHFLWEAPTGTHVTKLSAVADCKEDGLAVVDVTLSDGVHKFLGVQKGTHVELTKEDFVKKLEGAGCPHAHELPDDVLFAKLKESLKGTLPGVHLDFSGVVTPVGHGALDAVLSPAALEALKAGHLVHGFHHGAHALHFVPHATVAVEGLKCGHKFSWDAPVDKLVKEVLAFSH